MDGQQTQTANVTRMRLLEREKEIKE